MLRLPDQSRHHFRIPFGRLEQDLGTLVPELRDTEFYTVGDIVTQNALRHGLVPAVAVIDGHTMRRPYGKIPTEFPRVFRARNPAGTITQELVEALRGAVSSPPALVLVEGEEDLAVLPLALLAPDGGTILYGQPCEGVVVRKIDGEARVEARRLLAFFVAEPGNGLDL
ncbi:MAG: GTP-dependent dephospho-CoA kinase family protein [Methanolinea sp.]|nr:GTP-dependent dephospho-CoA kinase family protein [Methanolinea sp.]